MCAAALEPSRRARYGEAAACAQKDSGLYQPGFSRRTSPRAENARSCALGTKGGLVGEAAGSSSKFCGKCSTSSDQLELTPAGLGVPAAGPRELLGPPVWPSRGLRSRAASQLEDMIVTRAVFYSQSSTGRSGSIRDFRTDRGRLRAKYNKAKSAELGWNRTPL